jgi:GntR family histidine utilization transcriptional repressor
MSEGPVSRQTQIRDYILRQITSGAWPENHRIPSEHELVAQLKVARMTVHHALKELRDKGFLTRVQGIGTFVAKSRNYVTILDHSDIVAEVVARGGRHEAEILTRQVRRASAAEAARFRVRTGSRLFHAVVLHREDGRPVQLEDRLINIAIAPGCAEHDIAHESLFAYLMRLRPYREGEEQITARRATGDEQRALSLAAEEPVLEVMRTTWSGPEVVTTVRLIHPGSRFELRGRITSRDGRA